MGAVAVIVDCAHYRDGRRQGETPISLDDASAVCTRADDGFVWLGMFEPWPQELADVQERFGLHELAVEDAQSFHLRPKIEQYDDRVYFTVFRTARYDARDGHVEFGEISVFLGNNFGWWHGRCWTRSSTTTRPSSRASSAGPYSVRATRSGGGQGRRGGGAGL
jgi:CorA-like Mg2+ transporter protein